jgi:hypothetical protein
MNVNNGAVTNPTILASDDGFIQPIHSFSISIDVVTFDRQPATLLVTLNIKI